MSNADRVDLALHLLRHARQHLKEAGALRTKRRVDLAISSAKGARRHAQLEPYRRQRQAVAHG